MSFFTGCAEGLEKAIGTVGTVFQGNTRKSIFDYPPEFRGAYKKNRAFKKYLEKEKEKKQLEYLKRKVIIKKSKR